jgi:DNA-binding MarR family transcriptional regulator
MLRDHSVKVYILKAMVGGDSMSFVEIRDQLGLTDGNTYPNLQSLLLDEYIEKVPTVDNITIYRITTSGKMALNEYIKRLLD